MTNATLSHTLPPQSDPPPPYKLLGIPEHALDALMAHAYKLYEAGQYQKAEELCRGLVSANPSYGWTYSLYAAVMQQQGRFAEALSLLDTGLKFEPNNDKLIAMKRETSRAIAQLIKIATPTSSNNSSNQEVL